MIDRGEADLGFDFAIDICQWDGRMTFPGYSVSTIPGDDNSVRLVKNALA
jgi:hypothetical protein